MGLQSSKQSTTKDLNEREDFTPHENALLEHKTAVNNNAIYVDGEVSAKFDTFG